MSANAERTLEDVVAGLLAIHRPHSVTERVPVFDEYDLPFQTSVKCFECNKRWPCETFKITTGVSE